MARLRKLAFALAASSIAATGVAVAAAAADKDLRTFAPREGVTFAVGSKTAVGYYLAHNGACDLTLLVHQGLSNDEPSTQSASRFKVSVGAGKPARLDTAEGKSLEFKCGEAAQKMSVRVLHQVSFTPAN